MDKRGEWTWAQIAGLLLVIALVVTILMIRGDLWKKTTAYIKELIEMPAGELEALKQTQKQIVVDAGEEYKRFKEIAEMRGILLDASNFIIGKNEKQTYERILKNKSKVQFDMGGGNTELKPNYDKAIEKYLEYSKRCKYSNGEVTVASCTLPKTGIQFRILNALREKFYVLIKDGGISGVNQANKEFGGFDTTKYDNLISERDFKTAIVVVFWSAYTAKAKTEKDYNDADNFRILYFEKYVSDEDTLDREYASMVSYYFSIKKDGANEALCAGALASIKSAKKMIDDDLGVEKRLNIPLYYRFINEPYKELNTELCTS